MFKLFKTLLFIILLSSFANAEIVERVDITGNKRVSNETIKIYGNITLNQDYTEKKLNEILNSLYSTNFFEDIKIQIDSGVLKIVVKEFPVINQLIVVGEPSKKIAKEIKKVMSLKEKDSFVESLAKIAFHVTGPSAPSAETPKIFWTALTTCFFPLKFIITYTFYSMKHTQTLQSTAQ